MIRVTIENDQGKRSAYQADEVSISQEQVPGEDDWMRTRATGPLTISLSGEVAMVVEDERIMLPSILSQLRVLNRQRGGLHRIIICSDGSGHVEQFVLPDHVMPETTPLRVGRIFNPGEVMVVLDELVGAGVNPPKLTQEEWKDIQHAIPSDHCCDECTEKRQLIISALERVGVVP